MSAAIGVALANPQSRVFLVEGDGASSRTCRAGSGAKELENLGIYLSLIMVMRLSYDPEDPFPGCWLGYDTESGLGFPDWSSLFTSFGIPVMEMSPEGFNCEKL